MKLRFKKGAVVRFELIGTADPIYKVGKVENVFDDEVVLVEQIGIEKEEKSDEFFGLPTSTYDQTRCIDGKKSHINRALIASWEYANRATAARSPIMKPDLTKATITYYDENGYCFGDGVDFGNIPDSSSKYLIVGKPNDDSDGLELSL